jgi:DedD protein
VAMAEPADINVDELRRRARRRLVGAVVLALGVAVVVPMLLETEQKPLGEDVSVKIPPIDDGKFVNRLNESRPNDASKGPSPPVSEAAKGAATDAPSSTASPTVERPSKYDTRLPDAPPVNPAPAVTSNATAAAVAGASPSSAAPDTPPTTGSHPAVPVPSASPAPAKTAPVEIAKATAPTANAAPSAAKGTTGTASHDGFAVQLAAFADDRGANALAGRLKKAGYTAYTEPLKTSKGTLWRVRVGPYPSREAATAARDRLKTEGQSGIVAAIK